MSSITNATVTGNYSVRLAGGNTSLSEHLTTAAEATLGGVLSLIASTQLHVVVAVVSPNFTANLDLQIRISDEKTGSSCWVR